MSRNIIDLNLIALNFTQTFNPYKFTTTDTLFSGQELFRKYVNQTYRKFGPDYKYWYVLEKHENNRYHMHGQFYISFVGDRQTQYKFYDCLSGLLKKYIGICVLKWNDKEPRLDKDYKTWEEYCLKEKISYISVENGEVSYLSYGSPHVTTGN